MASVNRSLTYDSINEYYINRTANYSIRIPLSPTIPVTFDELVANLTAIAYKYGIPLDPATPTWEFYIQSLSSELQIKVNVFREIIFCTALLYVTQELTANHPMTRPIPPEFDVTKIRFTIVGAQKLTSDIDITIHGPMAVLFIMIIEDCMESLNAKNIPIRSYDLEFYGDYHILQDLYINVGNFSEDAKRRIFVYATISYMRSTHNNTLSPAANALLQYAADLLGMNGIDQIIKDAERIYESVSPGHVFNRENFYRDALKVENTINSLKDYIVSSNGVRISDNSRFLEDKGISLQTVVEDLFFTMSNGNINRPESYILSSTAVHVVDMEQRKLEGMPRHRRPSWITSQEGMELDNYAYLASAIEQLGYLEYYHPRDVKCRKKGIKYFGRLVRALVHTGIPLDHSMRSNAVNANTYRGTPNTSFVTCPVDIQTVMSSLAYTMKHQKGGMHISHRKMRKRGNRTRRGHR